MRQINLACVLQPLNTPTLHQHLLAFNHRVLEFNDHDKKLTVSIMRIRRYLSYSRCQSHGRKNITVHTLPCQSVLCLIFEQINCSPFYDIEESNILSKYTFMSLCTGKTGKRKIYIYIYIYMLVKPVSCTTNSST